MLRLIQKGVVILLATICLLFCNLSAYAQDVPGDYQDVLKFLDRKGDFKAGVLKVNIPRSDLKISIQGFSTPTPFGFGGWIALTKGADGSDVMMGDLVLLQEEVNPVMSALVDNGIDVTALHNHFFWDDPHVFFMHVHGLGKAADLARRVKPGLDLSFVVEGEALATFEKQEKKRDWKQVGESATSHFRLERTDAVFVKPVNSGELPRRHHEKGIPAGGSAGVDGNSSRGQ